MSLLGTPWPINFSVSVLFVWDVDVSHCYHVVNWDVDASHVALLSCGLDQTLPCNIEVNAFSSDFFPCHRGVWQWLSLKFIVLKIYVQKKMIGKNGHVGHRHGKSQLQLQECKVAGAHSHGARQRHISFSFWLLSRACE